MENNINISHCRDKELTMLELMNRYYTKQRNIYLYIYVSSSIFITGVAKKGDCIIAMATKFNFVLVML